MSNSIVAVIGGGAAGFFAALSAKHHFPDSEVIIFEKTSKLLSKVKVSGGGRCNVTHACFDPSDLAGFYPRGGKFLKKAFQQFDAKSTIEWFKKRSIPLVTLPDNCIFPKSNSSQTIIDCFLEEAKKLGITIYTKTPIESIEISENQLFKLRFNSTELDVNKVIVTTGGAPKMSQLDWLKELGLTLVSPVPSLFTFNMPGNAICQLMGIVQDPVIAKIEGTKLVAEGPLLITHWGMSGPAILKLSAWGARILEEKNYQFNVLIAWSNLNEEQTRQKLLEFQLGQLEKNCGTFNPFGISKRLWMFLLEKSEVRVDQKWKDLSKKAFNKLVNTLSNDAYAVNGKTTFKEEFVTAGGVSLSEINVQTMEAKKIPGLFFAGEIMDIDGITGGFNFQAAWTTAWIAGKNVLK